MKSLSFDVQFDDHDGSYRILLFINKDCIIRFASLDEYEKFANDMQKMVPEIKDNM